MPYKDIEARRACSRRCARKWYRKNRKRANAASRKYHRKLQKDNPERLRAWRRASYKRHSKAIAKRRKKYFENRKPLKAAYDKKYHVKNRVKRNARVRKWIQENKPHVNAYARERRRTNPQFAIANNMRCRINMALRNVGLKRDRPLERMIGCSVEELIQHLEAKFKRGMSWTTRRRWHVDHIQPCAKFDLTDPHERARCFHFTNLQPLWALDNLRKGDSIAA